MAEQFDTPLSDQELGQLDAFLLSDACDEETLSVDEVHGYLTALIVGPEQVDEREWMHAVWGEPQFASSAEREVISDLMLRMYDQIEATLENGESFEPLAVEVDEQDGEPAISYEGWCYGFILGVDAFESQWESLGKDEQGLLAPIAQIALLASEEEPEMSDEEYMQWVELLPGAVTGLYNFWHA